MTADAPRPIYPSVPRAAERLLELIGADPEFCDLVLGDLAEEFAIRAQWDGQRAARRWYYAESLRVAPYLIRHMLREIGLRDLARAAMSAAAGILAVAAVESVMIRVLHVRLLLEYCVVARCVLVKPGLWMSIMLLWTMLDGLLGGYVAGRVGWRRPILGAAVTALVMVVAMAFPGRIIAPSLFLVLNTSIAVASILAGGIAAKLQRQPLPRVSQ